MSTFDSNFPDLGDWNRFAIIDYVSIKIIWFKFPRFRGLKPLQWLRVVLSLTFDSNFPDLGDWNPLLESKRTSFWDMIWFKFPRFRGLKQELKELIFAFEIFDSNFPDLGDWNVISIRYEIPKGTIIFDSNFPDLGDWNWQYSPLLEVWTVLYLIQISPI